MGRLSAICTIAIFQLVLTACSGPIAPLSAQKGSTILIPVAGVTPYEAGEIGFGGSQVTDHQRGTLVYKLDGPGGPELLTRGSSVVYPGFHSSLAEGGDEFVFAQVFSIVDIPNTPSITTGTHSLYVVRRHQGVDTPLSSAYSGQIAILPHSVDVGGGVMISGASTPFALLYDGFQLNLSDSQLSSVIPKPQIRVLLLGGAANPALYAAEFEIAFPESIIDIDKVSEALAPGNVITERAITWWTESSPGVLNVSMVSKNRIRGVSISFSLDDGPSAILDPAQVSVQAARGWDADGALVTPSLGGLKVY